ncbi:MAG: hypothetical protein GX556_04040 [Fibrobacter sp.]|nr:hypothetical protein [Fibrobacter sp.]
MKKCSECGRRLNEGENDLCPACESTKSHKKKRWGEIIVGIVVVVGGIVIKVLTGGKGGGKA